VAEQHLGKKLQCARCKQTFTVPAPEPEPPPEPEPEVELELQLDAGFPSAQGPVCRLEVGCASSAGRVRERNDDCVLVQHLSWIVQDRRQELALLAVADGMGGCSAGDQASRLAVRTLAAALAPLLAGALQGEHADPAAALVGDSLWRGLLEANRVVHRQASTDPACKGMGATAAAVLVWNGRAVVSHVGDCRVYHQHDERLTQVTQDQTLVARMVELGQLSAREAATHPARNEVAQAIGRRPDVAPSRHALTLQPGDWLLASCDGLQAHLELADIEEAVCLSAGSAAQLAEALVERANQRGGSDNCSVVAVRCC
jgi:protein phosphatase